MTLVEVMLATTILGLVAIGIAGLLIRSSQLSRQAASLGYRTAVLNAEVSRITAAPPGSLTNGTTVTVGTALPFRYTLTVTIATTGAIQTVTIVLTPTVSGAIAQVTRTLQRSMTGYNPFKT